MPGIDIRDGLEHTSEVDVIHVVEDLTMNTKLVPVRAFCERDLEQHR